LPSPWAARRAAALPVALISIELLSLLEAGLNLVEALQALAEKQPQGERHAVLAGLLEAIRRGEPFSQAVAGFPQHFPPLFVATLRASERTGSIREALKRYIAYQEELDRLRKKVTAALIYPAVLLGVGTLVLGFLLFYVVPRFAGVYEGLATELPFFSALLLALGRGVREHAGAAAALALACFAGAWYLARQPGFRAWLSAHLWRLPALGARMKLYQLARLYRTTGMLLRAGIPAVRALGMVEELLAAHLRAQLAEARSLIEQGRPMSAALGAAGLATPVAARMMAVGERSGEMGEMMERIAAFHDEELARFVEWFTRAFEPLLMAALGVAIGLVVVLMYMPVFELAGSIP
ncbi:MAG: type II secretion system F family protein, partial [Burkholderiales bacterium]